MSKLKAWLNSKLLLPLNEYEYGEWLPCKSNNGYYVRRAYENEFMDELEDGFMVVYYHNKNDTHKYAWTQLTIDNRRSLNNLTDDWCIDKENTA